MKTPDETAEALLKGALGRREVTFSWFRQAMFETYPEYLTDQEIHDLFLRHSDARLIGRDSIPVGERVVDQAMEWLDKQEAHILKEVDPDELRARQDADLAPTYPLRQAPTKEWKDMTIAEVMAGARKKILNVLRMRA